MHCAIKADSPVIFKELDITTVKNKEQANLCLNTTMASNMEVDAQPNVMASTGTSGSVSVSLHPLVIMNISEHWTRVRAQEGKPVQGK